MDKPYYFSEEQWVEWLRQRGKDGNGGEAEPEAPRANGPEAQRAEEAEGATEAKDDGQKKSKAYRFALVRFADIKLHDGVDYCVKGLLPRSGLAVVWGPPKCGKTFWIFDLLMHVALGWPYRGLKVQQGAVVYCALEGAPGLARRSEAFRQKRLADDADPPFYLMTTPLGLIQDAPALIADIKRQLGETRPAAICIDTLNRSLVGSESKDVDMGAYIRAADAIVRAFECLVVVVHHAPHDGDRPRGHGSLMGALDVQIAVRRDSAGNVIAELELAKDGEVGLTFTSRLAPVEIALDADNKAVSSCVIEPVELPDGVAPGTAPKPKKPPASVINAKHALIEAINEMGVDAPTSKHIPHGVKVVTVEQWRDYAERLGGLTTSNTNDALRKALDRAATALVAAKQIGFWKPHVWLAK